MSNKKPSFRDLALASEVVTEEQINYAINLFVRSKGGDPLVAAQEVGTVEQTLRLGQAGGCGIVPTVFERCGHRFPLFVRPGQFGIDRAGLVDPCDVRSCRR